MPQIDKEYSFSFLKLRPPDLMPQCLQYSIRPGHWGSVRGGFRKLLCPICCLSARERRDAYSFTEYKVGLHLEEDKTVFTGTSGKTLQVG